MSELLVSIGLDSREFDRGIGKVRSGIGDFGTWLAGLARDSVVSAAKLKEMSDRTGVAVERLSGLAYAAGQSGTSIEQVEGGLTRFNRVVMDAARGSPEAARGFDTLGISIRTSEGQMKSAEVLMSEIADEMAKTDQATRNSAAAQELFGRSGANLIPMLAGGAQGLRDMQTEATAMGQVFSGEFAGQSDQLLDDITAIKGSFTGIGMALAKDIMPELLKVTAEMKRWSIEGGAIQTTMESIGVVVKKITDGIAYMGQGAGALSVAVEQAASGNTGAAAAALGGGAKTQAAMDLGIGTAQGAMRSMPGGEILHAMGIPGFASGGVVPGTGNSDSVLAMLTPGETVLPKGAGIGGGATSSGGGQSLGERVRAFWASNTAAGVRSGMEDGGRKGMGKPKGEGAAGLASTIFMGSLESSTKGLTQGIMDGDVKGAVGDFAKDLGKSVLDSLRQSIMAALGKKLMGAMFGGMGMPAFASGGTSPGGPILVGERGREIVMPPAGSRILSNSETEAGLGATFDLRGSSFSFGGGQGRVDTRMALDLAQALEMVVRRNQAPGLVAALNA